MNELKVALERVILELDIWCDAYHPLAYTDPTISLRQITDRARYALNRVHFEKLEDI
jgi:hypothetical protein